LPKVVALNNPSRAGLQIHYDPCDPGSGNSSPCNTQFPQIVNTTTIKIFSEGSVLVPLNITNFYLTNVQHRSVLMRNDGGSIVPDPTNGGFMVTGGTETIVGEADGISINYLINDNTIQPTPVSPLNVNWIKNISGVNVQLTRNIPWLEGHENLTRT